MNPGGKGANQAVAIARLGAPITFICKTGTDIFGHQSQQLFESEGINTSYIFSDPVNPSGVALISVDDNAENCIVVASGANANLTPEDLKKAEEAIDQCDIVLLQLEIPMETVEYVAKIASEKGKKVILNPAPAQPLSAELLSHLYLVTPNETEAEGPGSPFTRLVIEGKVDGTTYYWPININRKDGGTGISRNCRYVFDVRLTRLGHTDPDIPVETEDAEIIMEVQPWEELEEYGVRF